MIESWRWFGPRDPVTLPEIRQTGAGGVVTALHDIPNGALWRLEARTGRTIPMRPDHGHRILNDLTGTSTPGYPAIGRLRGLAELRGVTRAVDVLDGKGQAAE